MTNDQIFQATYTATAGTASMVSSGVATLHTIIVPKATVGTLTYKDKSGNTYFALPTASVGPTYVLDMVCNDGLILNQSSGSDQIVTTWSKP